MKRVVQRVDEDVDLEEFDVVVVGSGFGGAVVACRLAEAHRKVLLLERGRPYPPGSFARTPREWRSAFWAPEDDRHGLFELWRFQHLNAVCASGLGGGSLIYANVMIEKDPTTTVVRESLAAGQRECWPLAHEDLAPHYARRAGDAAARQPTRTTRAEDGRDGGGGARTRACGRAAAAGRALRPDAGAAGGARPAPPRQQSTSTGRDARRAA